MHRLFFAAFPPAAAIDAVAGLATGLKGQGVRGRWVDPARYHMTLLYLGEFAAPPDGVAAAAASAASTVAGSPFELVLDGLRTFPMRRPPWVLAGASAAAAELSASLREALSAVGIAHEPPRPFVPHLTLLYGETTLPDPRPVSPIAWRVTRFHLVGSRTGVAALERRADFALG